MLSPIRFSRLLVLLLLTSPMVGCGPELPPYDVAEFRTMEQWAELDPVNLPQEAQQLLDNLEAAVPPHITTEMTDQKTILKRIRDWADPMTVVTFGQVAFARDRELHTYEVKSDGSVEFKVMTMHSNKPISLEQLKWEVRTDAGWVARWEDLDKNAHELFKKYAEDKYLLFSSQFHPSLAQYFE